MFSKRIALSLFSAVLILASAGAVPAQDATSPPAPEQQAPDVQKQQEEKLNDREQSSSFAGSADH